MLPPVIAAIRARVPAGRRRPAGRGRCRGAAEAGAGRRRPRADQHAPARSLRAASRCRCTAGAACCWCRARIRWPGSGGAPTLAELGAPPADQLRILDPRRFFAAPRVRRGRRRAAGGDDRARRQPDQDLRARRSRRRRCSRRWRSARARTPTCAILAAPAELPECITWAVIPRGRVLRDYALALLRGLAPQLDRARPAAGAGRQPGTGVAAAAGLVSIAPRRHRMTCRSAPWARCSALDLTSRKHRAQGALLQADREFQAAMPGSSSKCNPHSRCRPKNRVSSSRMPGLQRRAWCARRRSRRSHCPTAGGRAGRVCCR